MPKAKAFSVCLTIAGKHYSAQGKTIQDALGSITPTHVKYRGVFVVSHEGKKGDVQLLPAQIKKLFANKMLQEIFAKRMAQLMK